MRPGRVQISGKGRGVTSLHTHTPPPLALLQPYKIKLKKMFSL